MIELRGLTPADLPEMAELLARIENFDLDDYRVAMELLTIVAEQPTQLDYDVILAVDATGIPIGYICFGPTPLTDGTFDLYWIAVEPRSAGKGLGTRLLQAMEDKVRHLRGRMIIIETSSMESYGKTHQFYLKNGYALAETLLDFYREGEHRETYIKRLT